MRKVTICTTTIFAIDEFLKAYVQNIKAFGSARDVSILIAGDNKSPAGCVQAAEQYRQQGVDVRFLTLDWQIDYLKRFPDLASIIPENSDNRRNVAYLLALEEGADVIISVDDDNFPSANQDFVGQHLAVGTQETLPEAIGKDGWFNLCSLLLPEAGQVQDVRLYPRGFPYKKRQRGTEFVGPKSFGQIGVNVGLWMLDPDTDAIGRLYAAPWIASWDRRSVLLKSGVRCPINTQNTAISREAMAAYYYVRMGVPLRGMRLDRFGDIFSGYFLQVCADAVGDRIKIGAPLTEHRRNAHNLLVDLYNELAGIMILEDMADFLRGTSLPGDSYLSAYKALSHRLESFATMQRGFIWQEETRNYFKTIGKYMRIWADVVGHLV